MKMTREESIRNFREHWASLAITGTDDKKEYLSRHGFPYISCDCFLCEYATNGMEKDCNKCPIEWPETRTDMEYACSRSFYGDWEGAESPEERKRLAAIIRDLPERQEVKLKPKFSVGDKVYPVSKTVPGLENDIKEDVHWQKSEPRGYFFVTDIDEYKTKSTGKTVYVCNFRKNTTTGNCFFESDLRPYVEPEKKREPAFEVGDKVRVKNNLIPNKYYDGVRFAYEMRQYSNKETIIAQIDKRTDNQEGYRLNIDKGLWYWSESMLELIPSINRCPEDKTVTVQTITIEFKGPKTICTIENRFGTFKGRAKCHPTDHWNEKTGADLALERAFEKFNEYQFNA